MKLAILIILFLKTSLSLAENTPIIKCRVSNSEWTSVFILDAVGNGFLKFKETKNSESYDCKLRIRHIYDGQSAVVPLVTVEFQRRSCSPELNPMLQKEILNTATLTVKVSSKEKNHGHVQWLRSKQPDNCSVERLSLFDITMNTKKWLEGTWGRKPVD